MNTPPYPLYEFKMVENEKMAVLNQPCDFIDAFNLSGFLKLPVVFLCDGIYTIVRAG